MAKILSNTTINTSNVTTVSRQEKTLNVTGSKFILPKVDIGRVTNTGVEIGKSPKIYPQETIPYSIAQPNPDILRDSLKNGVTTSPFLEHGNINRILYQMYSLFGGDRDPREPFNDTPYSPIGMTEVYSNLLTNEFEIFPKIIKEPYKCAVDSPFGPIRASLSEIYRNDVRYMYSLQYPTLTEIGIDSTGKAMFTDGGSYIEKCINMGYYKSAIPFKLWKPSQQKNRINQPIKLKSEDGSFTLLTKNGAKQIKSITNDNSITLNLVQSPEVFENIVLISKSGYYMSKRPPLKGLFLGYNEDENNRPPIASFKDKSRDGTNYFYNDRLCENELTATATRIGNQPKLKKIFMEGVEQDLYAPSKSYRKMLGKLSKTDSVDIKTLKSGISSPVLRRKSEQYGPNPLQHLYYMDYFDWRKYSTIYIPNNEMKLNIGNLSIPQDCISMNFFEENVFPLDGFLKDTSGRFSIKVDSDTIYCQDTTHILDIYYGLMEMHLKSYSWNDIFKIIDIIPEFSGAWNDSGWQSLSFSEKNAKRISELNANLPSIWKIIQDVLDNTIA